MKKLLYILFAVCLFTACSSDDNEPTQDYTSFTVTINSSSVFNDCVAGYKVDGKYKKLGDLGELTEGKTSPEIRLTDNSITEIYIFADLGGGTGVVRADATYTLEKFKKNIITVIKNTKGISVTDTTDPTQYPQ